MNFKEENKQVTTDSLDPSLAKGTLDDLLRQKLNNLLPSQSISQNSIASEEVQPSLNLANLVEQAVSEVLSSEHLDASVLEPKLEALFDGLFQVYQNANIATALRKRQFISRHGLIISPDYCVTTQKDLFRVHSFIRAADKAIADLMASQTTCLHIVYPACGPFAPLLLPLISYYQQTGRYDENALRVTLIDMQPGAVASLQAVIHELEISGYIEEVLCLDACDYQATKPIHLVVLEAMQHGFSKEGHLPMARHFAEIMVEDGIMLPEEIRLNAVLTVAQQEFVEQWRDTPRVCQSNMQQQIMAGRIELGEILCLNRHTLGSLIEHVIDEDTRLIQANTLSIPKLADSQAKPTLLICTQITTYREESIGEYDSGITHPLPDMQVCVNFTPKESKPGDLLVKSGDSLTFYYRLNGLPGFLVTHGAAIGDSI